MQIMNGHKIVIDDESELGLEMTHFELRSIICTICAYNPKTKSQGVKVNQR